MSVHVTWCFPLPFCHAFPEFTSFAQLWPWWVSQKVSDINYHPELSEESAMPAISQCSQNIQLHQQSP